ncbi:unnamed protein product [Oikopleura dioica]|uniref:Amino acid transporter transmembrane domain-containing protein n=1 Tax=Oikopleura dioica TaxID=34765 RepID=E4XWY6_OIKDI|nr:unnamed protein product [Oikopleura dioica]
MGQNEGQFGALTGSALIFNTVVGMGIWALPKMIYEAGTVASYSILIFCGFISFVVASFINELQGAANAVKKANLSKNPKKVLKEDEVRLTDPEDELDRIDQATIYTVTERFELTSAVQLILGDWPAKINNILIILSIQVAVCAYIVTFAETFRNLYCRPLTCQSDNFTEDLDDSEKAMCGDTQYTEKFIYTSAVILILAVTAPFCAMGVGNNTSVQMLGTIFRWITIILVLIISIVRVGDSDAKFSTSPTNWARMPLMFGMANSAFGCHEALPSLLFPIKQKRNNVMILIITFSLIGFLFLLLSTTALTAFDGPEIADLYLLNFQNDCDLVKSSFVRMILTFYPIIPAVTNFIIFHVVCQRNLEVMLPLPKVLTKLGLIYQKIFLMTLSSLVPLAVSLTITNVGLIFSVGGAFTTIFSSFFFPTLMVMRSRSMLADVPVKNPLASPMQSNFWIFLVFLTIAGTVVANAIAIFFL